MTFLEKWNGVAIVTAVCKRPADASGRWGCGGYLGRKWFQLPWGKHWQDIPIAVKELLPIVIACSIWNKEMAGLHIRYRCDNMVVVSMVNKGTSKHKVAAHLLRCLALVTARAQISLSACHPQEQTTAQQMLRQGESYLDSTHV